MGAFKTFVMMSIVLLFMRSKRDISWFPLRADKLISYTFQQCKNFENRLLRFDKVTESIKVGPFLRHSVLL